LRQNYNGNDSVIYQFINILKAMSLYIQFNKS